MKKTLVLIIALVFVLTACGNKYESEIEKVSTLEKKHWNTQENETFKKFDENKADFYVYEDGKVVVVNYNILKDSDTMSADAFKINETTGEFEELDHFDEEEYQRNNKPDYELKNSK
ncbi:hypothetical protein TP70_03455 [Staphylococcus microti]|uniref:Lipoprotein, putative n=1 Tax=Staphylococcus microti TaxID=569857 RepID=A0A0D6XTP5_9STAP|nr:MULTISPECIES: cystatin-like fold lipoprotein [Staphylococcus]KIX91228.1 hypothetical protein TP70_03455 [Staphylococcus microti]PNZ75784.1 hypothetical protein CD132_12115 [Staphylococcus microti]SUM58296.1 lipoprotein, putative [Staphylococcus microti]